MIIDKLLQFSDAQAVTATAASTDYIDFGLPRNLGVGEELYIFVLVTTAMTDSGSDSTVTVSVECDSTSTFTPDTTKTLFTFPAVSPAGTIKYARISPDDIDLRYCQLKYTVSGGNLSTGSFTAGIVKDIQAFKAYASGYTISV